MPTYLLQVPNTTILIMIKSQNKIDIEKEPEIYFILTILLPWLSNRIFTVSMSIYSWHAMISPRAIGA